MPEKVENKAVIIPEKQFCKRRNPQGIRVVLLKTIELLIIYSRPATITELKKMIEDAGLQVNRRVLNESLLNDIAACPVPGYVLQTKFTTAGKNKQVKAYQLKKITCKSK